MTKFVYHVKGTLDNKVILVTNSFQTSIDCWSAERAKGFLSFIEISEDLEPPFVSNENKTYRVINSRETIKEWSDYLMLNNYNRVEKRIMKEMKEQEHDGMEIVETRDTVNFDCSEEPRFRDEIEGLMGAVYEGAKAPNSGATLPDFHGNFSEMDKWTQEQIINPKHYKIIPVEAYEKHPEGLEYMDIMEYALAHLSGVESHTMGHVFKYSFRIGKKDAKLQDAKKIAWYANRMVEILEKGE